MLVNFPGSLQASRQERNGVNDVAMDELTALGEPGGGRIDVSQAMGERQPESQAAQPQADPHVVSPFILF